MPTAPNPTPPTAEPSTGEPAPVYDTTKPSMLGQYVEATKSSLGYVDHDYSTSRFRSPYYSTPVAVSVPGLVVFDGVCPGRWSRRYTTAKAAADLTGGSGYFGYDTNDQGFWWSTNFIDDGDSACTMVTSGGKYYSKNTTVGNDTILMGAITVEGTTVKLKWGSTWGVVTRNACFDYLSNNSYIYRSSTIPRQTDGKVDVSALNKSVMQFAPVRGCYVMFDMSSNQVLYTMLDGEKQQLSSSDGSAPAVQSRDATDPSSLPLTSKLTGLPTFTSGSVTTGGVGASSWSSDTTTQPDRTRTWLQFSTTQMDWTGSNQNSSTDQATARSPSNIFALILYQGTFYGKVVSGTLTGSSIASYMYSGWIRAGTSTQCVGWVGGGTYLGMTAYGMTSVAPSASITGSAGFNLTSANVQSEIVSRMPANSSFGFNYDASIGDYGRVTWISQL